MTPQAQKQFDNSFRIQHPLPYAEQKSLMDRGNEAVRLFKVIENKSVPTDEDKKLYKSASASVARFIDEISLHYKVTA